MSLFYKVAYGLGFHPWEDLAAHPPFADQLLSLVTREEHGLKPPYGPALDLGCGSAVWGGANSRSGVDTLPGWTMSPRPSGAPRSASATPVSR
jgi:hypothetical protein